MQIRNDGICEHHAAAALQASMCTGFLGQDFHTVPNLLSIGLYMYMCSEGGSCKHALSAVLVLLFGINMVGTQLSN